MRIFLLFLALFPAIALAQQSPTLASLKDKNRVLLVFAASNQDPNFQRQIATFNHHLTAMQERDLVLIPIITNVGPPTGADTLRTVHPATASDQQQIELRHRFHVASNVFAAILIGKDGGEKLRQRTPITAETLNATIDAMPMRQDEIRSRSKQ